MTLMRKPCGGTKKKAYGWLTADERYHCSISWFRYKNKRELTKRIFMYSVDYLSSIKIRYQMIQ